jgi:hypothetical protein
VIPPSETSARTTASRFSDAVDPVRAAASPIGTSPPVEASTTRASPARHLPTHTVITLRGMRKYSMVRASANEFGGIMQTSPLKSTKERGSKLLGSTIEELMLVKILNSSAMRMS